MDVTVWSLHKMLDHCVKSLTDFPGSELISMQCNLPAINLEHKYRNFLQHNWNMSVQNISLNVIDMFPKPKKLGSHWTTLRTILKVKETSKSYSSTNGKWGICSSITFKFVLFCNYAKCLGSFTDHDPTHSREGNHFAFCNCNQHSTY